MQVIMLDEQTWTNRPEDELYSGRISLEPFYRNLGNVLRTVPLFILVIQNGVEESSQ